MQAKAAKGSQRGVGGCSTDATWGLGAGATAPEGEGEGKRQHIWVRRLLAACRLAYTAHIPVPTKMLRKLSSVCSRVERRLPPPSLGSRLPPTLPLPLHTGGHEGAVDVTMRLTQVRGGSSGAKGSLLGQKERLLELPLLLLPGQQPHCAWRRCKGSRGCSARGLRVAPVDGDAAAPAQRFAATNRRVGNCA